MKMPSFIGNLREKSSIGNIHFGKILLTLMLISVMLLGDVENVSAGDPLYYYDKYISIPEYSYEVIRWDFIRTQTDWSDGEEYLGSTEYSIDPLTGNIRISGLNLSANSTPNRSLYDKSADNLVRYSDGVEGEPYSYGEYYTFSVHYGIIGEVITGYSRGSLVQSNIVAEDDTYPLNGRHSNGYWYVRKGLANNNPTITLSSPGENSYFSKINII